MEGVLDNLKCNKELHESVKHLDWLLGEWKSESGNGKYADTIQPFNYAEQISFSHAGQPMLIYNAVSWNNASRKPMHLESGFLKVKPGTNEVSMIVAHNFGLTTIEEGKIENNQITLLSVNIGRSSFAKGAQVKGIVRSWSKSDDGDVMYEMHMETDSQPMQFHLSAKYSKVLMA